MLSVSSARVGRRLVDQVESLQKHTAQMPALHRALAARMGVDPDAMGSEEDLIGTDSPLTTPNGGSPMKDQAKDSPPAARNSGFLGCAHVTPTHVPRYQRGAGHTAWWHSAHTQGRWHTALPRTPDLDRAASPHTADGARGVASRRRARRGVADMASGVRRRSFLTMSPKESSTKPSDAATTSAATDSPSTSLA
jgi:hypothetical protein